MRSVRPSHPLTPRTVGLAICVVLASSACKKEENEEDDRAGLTKCKVETADGRGGVAIGFPRYSDRLESTGKVVATVIMVDFSDAEATMTPDEALALIDGASATFEQQSYGRLDYELAPAKHWYRMSKPSTAYGTDTYEAHRAYIQEAVDLADDDVDFSTTDSLVILTNPDATAFAKGPAFSGVSGNGVTADDHEMLNAVTSGHDLNEWESIWLNHEVTHTLGLPDLYAYDLQGSSSYDAVLRFTGEFSYMGFNSFDSHAPGLTAWERWVLGWLDDDQVSCVNPFADGEVTVELTPLGKEGGMKAAVVPLSETRVAVIESRRPGGLDANIEKAGALAYVVDSSVPSGSGPIRVYPVDSDDPRFLQAPRAEGESVDIEGLSIEVTVAGAGGDTVKLTAGD